MKNNEIIGWFVTGIYTNLLKNIIKVKYPNFFFERGRIIYDNENERYIYSGYSGDEQRIINEAESALLKRRDFNC